MPSRTMPRWLIAGPIFAAAGMAQAACDFDVEVDDTLEFKQQEMVADSTCETITVTIKHTGMLPAEAMGHNWVLSKAADYESVAIDGVKAGLENDYIKPGDDRVIAHTRVVGSGESDTISFSPSGMEPGGDYRFSCTFPGHWEQMYGTFILK